MFSYCFLDIYPNKKEQREKTDSFSLNPSDFPSACDPFGSVAGEKENRDAGVMMLTASPEPERVPSLSRGPPPVSLAFLP